MKTPQQMILTHPLTTENDANKKAIEKYKDRLVKIFSAKLNAWIGNKQWVSDKKDSKLINFKDALKITKHYLKSTGIEYHFEDEIGDLKTPISEFEPGEEYSCSTIIFDTEDKRR